MGRWDNRRALDEEPLSKNRRMVVGFGVIALSLLMFLALVALTS